MELIQVAPGLIVRLCEHTIGEVPCWSYITDGLRSFGQKEMVFTLRRQAMTAPAAPLSFFAKVLELARGGRLVDAGGHSAFGGNGFLGRPSLRGLGYVHAQPLDHVDVPENALAAVGLIGGELELTQAYGPTRVLARLGRAYGYFPFPPWSDPDRPSVANELPSNSILSDVAWAAIAGTRLMLADNRVTLSLPIDALPRLRAAVASQAPDKAFVMLGEPAPDSDGWLVWHPGQTQPSAIAASNTAATRLGAGFVLFAPEQDSDGGQIIEDGFAFRLTDATWARVRDAIAAGASLAIASSNIGFALEWYAARPAVSELRLVLGQPQREIEERVGLQALVEYAETLERVVRDWVVALPRAAGFILRMDVCLKTTEPELRLALTPFPSLPVAALAQRLDAVPPPSVRADVRFAGELAIWGGAPQESV